MLACVLPRIGFFVYRVSYPLRSPPLGHCHATHVSRERESAAVRWQVLPRGESLHAPQRATAGLGCGVRSKLCACCANDRHAYTVGAQRGVHSPGGRIPRYQLRAASTSATLCGVPPGQTRREDRTPLALRSAEVRHIVSLEKRRKRVRWRVKYGAGVRQPNMRGSHGRHSRGHEPEMKGGSGVSLLPSGHLLNVLHTAATTKSTLQVLYLRKFAFASDDVPGEPKTRLVSVNI